MKVLRLLPKSKKDPGHALTNMLIYTWFLFQTVRNSVHLIRYLFYFHFKNIYKISVDMILANYFTWNFFY